MGETLLFSSGPVGNTYTTLQIVIRTIWRPNLFLLYPHPNSVTLAVSELFMGLVVPQIVASWVCGGKPA